MIRTISIGAGAMFLAFGLPFAAHAQDAHTGHHPAETPAAALPPPPAGKMEGMMGKADKGPEGMPMNGMMDGSGTPMPCMPGMQMSGDVESRINVLRGHLKITPAQARDWDAFADVLRANAKRAGDLHASMMMHSRASAPPSLAERLDHRDRWLAAGSDNVRALKPALKRLYAALSAEQKGTADKMLPSVLGMMPAMPMGGMSGN